MKKILERKYNKKMCNIKVVSININNYKEWLLKKHYLKRLPSISYSFGLFENKLLVGVCTFGNAIPNVVKKSICGEKFMHLVYELNRLCTNDNLPKNINSFFVSRSLKMLPKPLIIVSYADKSVGHNGYIYQACNFIYTGKSHTQKDWKLKGSENKHSRTLMDEFAFQNNRIQKLKEKHGDKLYQVQRPEKHRYIYFLGNKTQKKTFHKYSKFKNQPYPKGNNKKYDASYKPDVQLTIL
tara:strand:- start:2608 stop:3324 length:717 start_codon:yes stop_codon:yes gene_type:complete